MVNKRSLQEECPDVSREWHPILNGEWTPNDVTSGSNKSAWWKCSKKHEWEARIYQRVKGSGCPVCAGKIVVLETSLGTQHPELAEEWNVERNGDLTPYDVAPNSNKAVWWRCSKNPQHEWTTRISNRSNGSQCPYCTGKKVSPQTSLQATHSQIASEWHPIKNDPLTPNDVSHGSNKAIWWQCADNPNHEWKDMVVSRTRGKGCPFCAERRK